MFERIMGRKKVANKLKAEKVIVPIVADVLKIVGAASLIGAALIIPAIPVVVTPILKFAKHELDRREELRNAKFDKVRLWLVLRRLEKQREVKLIDLADGSTQVKLTEKGRMRYLRFKLSDLFDQFSKKQWDGKWRIIVFDVPEKQRKQRDSFRNLLNALRFYELQESVYLAPYPCEIEMEYLREYHQLGKKVQILVTSGLEDDSVYRTYFGL